MKRFLPYLIIAAIIVIVWFVISLREPTDVVNDEGPSRVVPTMDIPDTNEPS